MKPTAVSTGPASMSQMTSPIPAETFYDARITWDLPDQRTTLVAWCKNLTDIDDHSLGGVPVVGVARTTTVGMRCRAPTAST